MSSGLTGSALLSGRGVGNTMMTSSGTSDMIPKPGLNRLTTKMPQVAPFYSNLQYCVFSGT